MTPPVPVTVFQTTAIPEFSPSNESFSIWKEKLDIHFCEINCTEDNQRKAVLLKSIGAVPYSVLHSLCSPEAPVTKTYKHLCETLTSHYTPPTIVFRERKKFHSSTKTDGETVADWYARVKKLALNCKFGTDLDSFILNQFIMSLPSKIFERLCEEDEKLTLPDALKKAMIIKTKICEKVVNEEEVNYIKNLKSKKSNGKAAAAGKGGSFAGSSGSAGGGGGSSNSGNKHNKQQKVCSHCGWRNHSSQYCKFKESKCHNCEKIGHLASVVLRKIKQ